MFGKCGWKRKDGKEIFHLALSPEVIMLCISRNIYFIILFHAILESRLQ